MKKLEAVLSEYAPGPPEFGPKDIQQVTKRAPPVPLMTSDQIDVLKKKVAEISSNNRTYFNVCFGLLVILFIGLAVLVVFLLHDPNQVKAVLAASGISFFGIIGQMLKLWKEKVASDITLALIMSLKAEDIRSTLEIILKGLR